MFEDVVVKAVIEDVEALRDVAIESGELDAQFVYGKALQALSQDVAQAVCAGWCMATDWAESPPSSDDLILEKDRRDIEEMWFDDGEHNDVLKVVNTDGEWLAWFRLGKLMFWTADNPLKLPEYGRVMAAFIREHKL